MQNKASEIRVTAKTLDLALSQAAGLLQIDQSQVDYRVVSQGGGLFAFLGKKIEIRKNFSKHLVRNLYARATQARS